MSTAERWAGTIVVLARAGKIRADAAQARLEEAEAYINQVLGGAGSTPALLPSVIQIVTQMIPPPEGFRWQAEQNGDKVSAYLELIRPDIPEGYRFAARVTSGWDGGNHPVKSDLLACKRCGSVIVAGEEPAHDGFHRQIDEAVFHPVREVKADGAGG